MIDQRANMSSFSSNFRTRWDFYAQGYEVREGVGNYWLRIENDDTVKNSEDLWRANQLLFSWIKRREKIYLRRISEEYYFHCWAMEGKQVVFRWFANLCDEKSSNFCITHSHSLVTLARLWYFLQSRKSWNISYALIIVEIWFANGSPL